MDELNITSSRPEGGAFGRFYTRGRYDGHDADDEPLPFWAIIIMVGLIGFVVLCPFCWACYVVYTDDKSKNVSRGLERWEYERMRSKFEDELANERVQRRHRTKLSTIDETGEFEEVNVGSGGVESGSGLNPRDDTQRKDVILDQELIEMRDFGGNGSGTATREMITEVEVHSGLDWV